MNFNIFTILATKLFPFTHYFIFKNWRSMNSELNLSFDHMMLRNLLVYARVRKSVKPPIIEISQRYAATFRNSFESLPRAIS